MEWVGGVAGGEGAAAERINHSQPPTRSLPSDDARRDEDHNDYSDDGAEGSQGWERRERSWSGGRLKDSRREVVCWER